MSDVINVTGVIYSYENNGYDDSDFFVDYWDGEKMNKLMVASTRFASCGNFNCVKATAEEKADAMAWINVKTAEKVFEKLWSTPFKGSTVEVVKGRKIKHGTIGEVFWTGMKSFDKYGRWPELQVGLIVDGIKMFTAAKNLKVVDYNEEAELKAFGTVYTSHVY
jgi:hypothetical protein